MFGSEEVSISLRLFMRKIGITDFLFIRLVSSSRLWVMNQVGWMKQGKKILTFWKSLSGNEIDYPKFLEFLGNVFSPFLFGLLAFLVYFYFSLFLVILYLGWLKFWWLRERQQWQGWNSAEARLNSCTRVALLVSRQGYLGKEKYG